MKRFPMAQVGTAVYEHAHGRKPRGVGLWRFELVAYGSTIDVSGLYGEAKREAQRQARELFNGSNLRLLP
jgi:hypothetical protein